MIHILQGDCRTTLATLPAESVHCAMTSPPYFGLRSYLAAGSPDKALEIGCGQALAEYVASMVDVARAVRRVLREDGTFWLNVGDSFNGSGGSGGDYNEGGTREGQPRYPGNRVDGLKPKDLCGVPWRLAFALQDDGWYLRSDIIWAKSSCMPESVTDRPTRAHEYVFLLTRSPRYFFDQEAVREADHGKNSGNKDRQYRGDRGGSDTTGSHQGMCVPWTAGSGRNIRDVWKLNPGPADFDFCEACGRFYSGPARSTVKRPDGSKTCACGRSDAWCDHYAMMPPSLAERCIKAGTSERGCCPTCGAPWARVVERDTGDCEAHSRPKRTAGMDSKTSTLSLSGNGSKEWAERGGRTTTTGWTPTCACPSADPVPCTVLDPFAGAGTTAMVAARLGRSAIGCELSPRYAALAKARIEADQPLLNSVEITSPR